ncbi:hypothetical protein CCR95_09715 [Thiocystis minor]|uniref:hypothetical protein n=1 Tax=Thiocystis minor TaxID=61597 RepID=UPI001912B163|nr:hypothetical protein [Thiocystis minor]MBK5964354.1 hypothetical protein [Thiocystis minor]
MTESSPAIPTLSGLAKNLSIGLLALPIPLPVQIANVVWLVNQRQAESRSQEEDQATEDTVDDAKPGLLSRITRFFENLPSEDNDHQGRITSESLGIPENFYQFQGKTIKIETVIKSLSVYEAYRFMNQDKEFLQKSNKTKISINWFATQITEANPKLKKECNAESYSKEHVRRIIRTMKYFDAKNMLEPIRQKLLMTKQNDRIKQLTH